MDRMNIDRGVPSSADVRLDELAQILARGILRMVTKKSGLKRRKSLELSAKTRLNVTTLNASSESEVT